MKKKRCTVIILAAGSGSRMKSATAKQFMLLGEKPLIWYSLNAAEKSEIIDDCVLVTSPADIDYVKTEIVEKYEFRKVGAVIAGGSERWESVANAVRYIEEDGSCLKEAAAPAREGYIFIHDGARPFLTEDIIRRTYEAVRVHHACVAAMPAKDTVKITDENGFVVDTPDRKNVWTVQTPQVFDAELIVKAYGALREKARAEGREAVRVTDDASVVEMFTDCPVKLTESSYANIKITTPEDLKIAESFLDFFGK